MISVRNGVVKSVHLIVGVLMLLLEVNCDNYTQKYPWDTFQTRENRLITFHTLDQGDIELELEFHVPFLTIPIKKTMTGALANINVGAIALTGAIVFGAVFALPGLLALLNKKGSQWSSSMYKTANADSDNDDGMRMEMMMMNEDNMMSAGGGKMNNDSAMKTADSARGTGAREKENANSSSGSGSEKRNKRYDKPPQASSSSSSYYWLQLLLTNLDSTTFLRDMRSTACLQRAICWTVRSSATRMLSSSAQAVPTSVDKIIDGLATNEWVRYWARDSLFDSAIQFGLRRSNCAKVFNECRLSQSVISMFVKRFSAMINNS